MRDKIVLQKYKEKQNKPVVPSLINKLFGWWA
jgi:hypothetical protein